MARRPRGSPDPAPEPAPPDAPTALPEGDLLPMFDTVMSATAEISRLPVVEPPAEPRSIARGLVVFDMDGTVVDSLGLISHVAADVLHRAFGVPEDQARIHYLATTGMPFEAQLAQLFPEVPIEERRSAAVLFHHRKITEAYAHSAPFPEMPRTLRTLSREGWTLAISTGAEREMAELMLEREGLRYWFEDVLGSGQGTKREHLREYQRRYPGAAVFMVGDSRFDMEAAAGTPGVRPLGRASRMHGWTLTPDDLRRWGALWADYTLDGLPEAVERLSRAGPGSDARAGERRAAPSGRPAPPRRARARRNAPPVRPKTRRVRKASRYVPGGPGPRVSDRGERPRGRLNPGRGIHSPPG